MVKYCMKRLFINFKLHTRIIDNMNCVKSLSTEKFKLFTYQLNTSQSQILAFPYLPSQSYFLIPSQLPRAKPRNIAGVLDNVISIRR